MSRLVIFGDSYSTYEGHIPEGYSPYYTHDGSEVPEHPVSKMELDQTWWRIFLKKTGAELVLNNSWSGSTICYTGYNATDRSSSTSFIYRYRQLKKENFFEKNGVDNIIVFGGTNDSWAEAPLGEMKYGECEEADLYSVLPAICHIVKTMKEDLPGVRLIFVANCGIKAEVINALEEATKHYGVELIKLANIEKEDGHPNPTGMQQICDQILKVWNK